MIGLVLMLAAILAGGWYLRTHPLALRTHPALRTACWVLLAVAALLWIDWAFGLVAVSRPAIGD
jgi:hypothetical protein